MYIRRIRVQLASLYPVPHRLEDGGILEWHSRIKMHTHTSCIIPWTVSPWWWWWWRLNQSRNMSQEV